MAAVFLAGVNAGALLTIRAARVLPRLAGVVPMETKLGQNAGDFGRLLPVKLNPNPLANHFGQFKEARGFRAQQRKQLVRIQRPIRGAFPEINLRSFLCAQLFGSVLEPRFRILSCCFHGLFFVLCCSVSASRPSPQKTV